MDRWKRTGVTAGLGQSQPVPKEGWGQWGEEPQISLAPTLLFQIIRKALTEEKHVSTKTSAADLVTETDHRVEDLIVSELRKRFPSHRWVLALFRRRTPVTLTTRKLTSWEAWLLVTEGRMGTPSCQEQALVPPFLGKKTDCFCSLYCHLDNHPILLSP